MSAAAKRAHFAPQPHRRAMIAKVHLASKQLGLDEDTYRSVLHEVTGHMSAADCSEADLARLVDHFRARGFRPLAKPKKPGQRAAADHAPARKARALWISLYHLAAIDNASEQALEAFARRQLKVEALQWADQAQCYKLIEALKAIAERHGWQQDDIPASVGVNQKIRTLKVRLLDAIVAKLKDAGLADKSWTLEDVAWRLCGLELPFGLPGQSTERLDEITRSLGAKLRDDRP